MKKSLLFAAVIFSGIISAQTTATNFTVNDCNGNNHDLFTELDAGKVIVMTWVMPCPGCINAASTASTTVLGYASSYPGRVKFYMVDDYANSTCSTLNTWATNNSITTDAVFSNAAINMSDYGAPGMPKTVVLGGGAHTIFYNLGGDITASVLINAIDSALAAPAAVPAINNFSFNAEVYPNPVKGSTASFVYELTGGSNVNIVMYNMLGEVVCSVKQNSQTAGKHEIILAPSSFAEGVYFVKLECTDGTRTVRFVKSN